MFFFFQGLSVLSPLLKPGASRHFLFYFIFQVFLARQRETGREFAMKAISRARVQV